MLIVRFGFVRRAIHSSVRQVKKLFGRYLPVSLSIASAYIILCYNNFFDRIFANPTANGDSYAIKYSAIVTIFAISTIFLFAQRINNLKKQVRKYAEAEDNLALTLNNMRDGIAAFDAEQRLVVSNQCYQAMYALPDDLVQPGTPFSQIIDRIRQSRPDMPPTAQFIENFLIRLRQGDQTPILVSMPHRVIAVSYRSRPRGGWVSTHEDITERSRLEKKLSYLALHDALTDLANRVLLREELERALTQSADSNQCAVLCLDLDRFKQVNDTLGHPIGDALLVQVAQRLRDCTADDDIIARMGGDEFAILQMGPQPTSAITLALKIVDAISAPYVIDGHNVVIGTSIGIAVAPGDGTNPDELLTNADLALYRSKSDGRGVYRLFDRCMNSRRHDRRQLELDLREALGNGQLELNYQPVLDLNSNEIIGLEALIRWNHPDHGRLLATDFVKLSEETRLIVSIGEWALREACAEAARWPEHVWVAVNISEIQLADENLTSAVINALGSANLAPKRLQLEIKEKVLRAYNDETMNTLIQLRNIGVHIAVDDFGAAYSWLNYFHSRPFDKIKIDRSFVERLNEGESAVDILGRLAKLAADNNIEITVEGVETQDQLADVRRQGVSQVQGVLISPPLSGPDIRQMLPTARGKRSFG